tara:strand:+ start:790 stop:942 length:153 start_codon:yes stop_codon:yes gene_type:complete
MGAINHLLANILLSIRVSVSSRIDIFFLDIYIPRNQKYYRKNEIKEERPA